MTEEQGIDEQLVRKLSRQIKIMNFWMTFFGILTISSLIIMGILTYSVVTFIRSAEQKISDIQTQTTETLNVKDDLCNNAIAQNLGLCKSQ